MQKIKICWCFIGPMYFFPQIDLNSPIFCIYRKVTPFFLFFLKRVRCHSPSSISNSMNTPNKNVKHKGFTCLMFRLHARAVKRSDALQARRCEHRRSTIQYTYWHVHTCLLNSARYRILACRGPLRAACDTSRDPRAEETAPVGRSSKGQVAVPGKQWLREVGRRCCISHYHRLIFIF